VNQLVARAASPADARNRRVSRNKRLIGYGVLALLWLVLPLYLQDPTLNTLSYCAVFAIGSIGLTLLTGYAGQVSLAQPFFMGIGAYAAAYMAADLDLAFIVFAPVATILGGLLGAVSGAIATRLQGSELAVITLGLLVLGDYLFNEVVGITGGENGKDAAAADLAIGPLNFEDLLGYTRDQTLFWALWALVALVAWMAANVARRRPGRAMIAVRDGARAAEAIGVDVRMAKIKVFTLASAMGAFAGVLYAGLQQYITPVDFDIFAAILFAAMIIIGGIDRISGAILGAIIVWGGQQWVSEQADSSLLSSFLKTTDGDDGLITVGAFNQLVFGLLIVLVLTIAPQGLLGLYDRIRARITGRRRVSALAADTADTASVTTSADQADHREESTR
jgi:branched-chain amino acid transport system permease protein